MVVLSIFMSSFSTHSLGTKIWSGRDLPRGQDCRDKNLLLSLERSITIIKTEEVHLKQPVVLAAAHYKVRSWDSKRRH